jgi:hypothetical protein
MHILTASVWGRAAGLGTDPRATAVEVCARLLALVEALERTDTLRVEAGEEAA